MMRNIVLLVIVISLFAIIIAYAQMPPSIPAVVLYRQFIGVLECETLLEISVVDRSELFKMSFAAPSGYRIKNVVVGNRNYGMVTSIAFPISSGGIYYVTVTYEKLMRR